MIFRNPEDALDAFRISHADLDVGLASESRGGIKRFAFGEYGSDGIERLLA